MFRKEEIIHAPIKKKIHLCVEVGSTHMGKKEYIKEIIERCAVVGADSVKFQLFPNKPKYTQSGNVYLPAELYQYAHEIGRINKMPIAASVFGEEEIILAQRFQSPFIKIAYSMKDSKDLILKLAKNHTVVVTSDPMTRHLVPTHQNIIHLFTATIKGETLYPNQFQLDFDGVFKPVGQYDGFSDHSLGVFQTITAVEAGAVWIEKHCSLNYPDIICPDARFALPIDDLLTLREAI